MVYLLFVIGFILLIKGADWLVVGSASVAKHYRISDMFIGLTIVSIGTSAPELIVNVIASLAEKSEIAIGNIFGSNISNVLLILGVTAIIYPIPIRRNTIRTDIPFVLIATLLVGFLANAKIFFFNQPAVTNDLLLKRYDGVILLLFFILFLSYAFKMNTRSNKCGTGEEVIEMKPLNRSYVMIILGVISLFFGGKWVVEGAVELSALIGLSEGFVGLTIIAVGTSLPELVTSIIAASKKNVDIAVGNIIGSNIFNLLWVLGVSAIINPLKFYLVHNFDILVMLFSSALIVIVISFHRRISIGRFSGILFVGFYLIYLVYLFHRG